jgi:hypothetical protein
MGYFLCLLINCYTFFPLPSNMKTHQYNPTYGYTPKYNLSFKKDGKKESKNKHLNTAMKRYLLHEEMKRKESYVGINSAPIIYMKPSNDQTLLQPYIPNIASLCMNTTLEEKVSHIYAPPPKDFIKSSSNNNSSTSATTTAATTATHTTNSNNTTEEEEKRKNVGERKMIDERNVDQSQYQNGEIMQNQHDSLQGSRKVSTSISKSTSRLSSVTKKGKKKNCNIDGMKTMKEIGVHYYSVKIEQNMTLVVLEMPPTENINNEIESLPLTEEETNASYSNEKVDIPTFKEKEVNKAKEDELLRDSNTPMTTMKNEGSGILTSSSIVDDSEYDNTRIKNSNVLPPLSSTTTTAAATTTNNDSTTNNNATVSLGRSSSIWYSTNGLRSRLKRNSNSQQPDRMELLKQPNQFIVQKMQSVANILQHRVLMEELGPAATELSSSVDNTQDFRPSVLSNREVDEDSHSGKDMCIIL